MRTDGRKYWLSIGAFVAVFAAILVTFGVYMQDTSDRVVAQNNQYIYDTTQQTTRMVSVLMENAEKDIKTIAALASENEESEKFTVSADWLEELANLAPFDKVDFVDRQGVLHTGTGVTVDVKDREYFDKAMHGKSGLQAVYGTRQSGENVIYFYAPVRRGESKEIIGLLLAHFSEERLSKILATELFGYESEVMLCEASGRVMASSDGSMVGTNVLVDAQKMANEGSVPAADIVNAFAHGQDDIVELADENGNMTSVCINHMPDQDWYVLETFPPDATATMIVNANETGWHALLIIVVVSVLVVVGIVLFNNGRHRKLTQAIKDQEDVQQALDMLIEQVVLINFQTNTYKYISGPLRNDPQARLDGPYELIPKRLVSMLSDPADKEDMLQRFNRDYIVMHLPEGTDDLRYEYEVTRNGEDRWEDFSFICVDRTPEGVPRLVVYVTQDVTDMKEREKQIQRAMQDSYRAAVAANNAKSDFLSRMSHDIRTPMNAIIGMTELARMSKGDPERVDDCLNKIQISGNHLLNLINEVLDLSMIESGKMVLNVSDVNLVDMISELEMIFTERCQDAGISFNVSVDNVTHPVVLCDSLRMQQVLMNLLGNAVKFTPSGKSISVRMTEEPSRLHGSSNYEFVVSDQGCGMKPDFVDHIFEPFVREHDSRIEKIEGTGLGLSIVNNIINLMGGSIDVYSVQGEGTAFTVRLNMRHGNTIQEAEEADQETADQTSVAEEPTSLEGVRVLLVEDNELNSEIAAALLASLGVEVEAAENGQIAIDKLMASEPGHFDLVLMDVQMPVKNGLEATQEIRQSERADLQEIPIIVLSANAFAEDERESKRMGANAHLSKPIRIKELSEALRTFVRPS